MVFVEYENEVEEEGARVKALLDKLRIDATVMVFWLASGELNTYELIINGKSNDIDWEIITNDALRDEGWWDDLQAFRGQSEFSSAPPERSELASIFGPNSGRNASYNPHDDVCDRRRASSSHLGEISSRPAISVLSKLGVNVGMHTTHLNENVMNESSSDDGGNSSPESSSDEHEDFDDDRDDDILTETDAGPSDPVQRPLLSKFGSSQPATPSSRRSRGRERGHSHRGHKKPVYGTMSTSQTLLETDESEYPSPADQYLVPKVVARGASPGFEDEGRALPQEPEPFPFMPSLPVPETTPSSDRRARSVSPSKHHRSTPGSPRAESYLARPSMSRQSSAMRFSSRPVPETTITAEGDDSRISFAPTPSGATTPKAERPSHSRQSSYTNARFSSRPMPETRFTAGDEGGRTISFADEPIWHAPSANPSVSHSRHHSRQSSASTYGDLSFSVANLLENYRRGQGLDGENEGGSTYSTQSFSLSFNDLPSRAQHLVLNELMRRNSTETAVTLTTLPVPAEDTSRDELDTISYLSDIELLCNELPPTLLVLSNSMTVTVGL